MLSADAERDHALQHGVFSGEIASTEVRGGELIFDYARTVALRGRFAGLTPFFLMLLAFLTFFLCLFSQMGASSGKHAVAQGEVLYSASEAEADGKMMCSSMVNSS